MLLLSIQTLPYWKRSQILCISFIWACGVFFLSNDFSEQLSWIQNSLSQLDKYWKSSVKKSDCVNYRSASCPYAFQSAACHVYHMYHSFQNLAYAVSPGWHIWLSEDTISVKVKNWQHLSQQAWKAKGRGKQAAIEMFHCEGYETKTTNAVGHAWASSVAISV